ncbi:MAG: hypothetical protein HQ510_06640 [Candidatus Marinimicrobia bacterium]|nr:hypothetical protein [Candidatus Neomarinimicrobiota bacterium]
MTASTHLKQITVILMIVMWTFSFAVQVTFQVDMQYQDVSPNGVHIAGGFQYWNPTTHECTLVSDAIYAATFEMVPGDYYEYLYVNGDMWGLDETVLRNITVPDTDTILYPVYYNNQGGINGSPVTVTFHLNTSIMPGWTDSTKTIVIRGSFNSWGGNDWQMVNVGGDYWTFTSPIPLYPANYEYKYINTNLWNEYWESIDNRVLEITGDEEELVRQMEYFNADGPPYIETDGLDAYFRVCTLGIAGYDDDNMYTVGSFEGWLGTLMTDEGAGDFWGLSYSFDVPTQVEYNFQHGIGGWEGIENRTADITQDTTLAFVFWDNQPPSCCGPVEKTIIFQVDMAAWLDEDGAIGMSVFSIARNDTLEVRGGFNGWSDNDPTTSVMVRQPGTNIFSLPVSITNFPELTMEYKYFIKHSAESVSQLESEYGPMYTNMGMEEPLQFGGLPRSFTLDDTEEDIYTLPLASYYDLPQSGTIPAGHQIITTYTIDMSDAGTSGFVPGDEVRLVLKDKWTNYLQGFGDLSSTVASDNGDGTYTAIVTLTGPVPWHTIYVWEFEGANLSVQEGGGSGYGKCRVRYMCPTSGIWNNWNFPVDIWTEEPPLLVEDYQNALECLGCLFDENMTGDGSVNVVDIVVLVSHILQINLINDQNLCLWDCMSDGNIDVNDIVCFITIILDSEVGGVD